MDLEYRKSKKTEYFDHSGNPIPTDETTASSGSSGDVISAGQEDSGLFASGKVITDDQADDQES
jgi:hypothetical protein